MLTVLQPTSHKSKSTLYFIQYFRGIAALLVVLWHGSIFLGPYGDGIGGILFSPGGSMGVDLFFIISGFIMVYATTLLAGGKRDAIEFFVNRFTRIVPVYFIFTIATFFIENQTNNNSQSVSRLVKSLLFIPDGGGFGPVYGWPTVVVGWTLNYEVYFYIVFGISLLLGKLRWLFLFSSILSAIYILPMLAGRTINPLIGSSYEFSITYLNLITNPIILLFLIGVVIGIIYNTKITINKSLAIILMLVSLSMVVTQYSLHYNTEHGYDNWGITLIPMVLCFAIASKTVQIPKISILKFLGDISYSLYLTHPMMMGFHQFIMKKIGLSGYTYGFVGLFIFTVVSIIFAAMVNKAIERYLSDKIKERMKGYFLGEMISASVPKRA